MFSVSGARSLCSIMAATMFIQSIWNIIFYLTFHYSWQTSNILTELYPEKQPSQLLFDVYIEKNFCLELKMKLRKISYISIYFTKTLESFATVLDSSLTITHSSSVLNSPPLMWLNENIFDFATSSKRPLFLQIPLIQLCRFRFIKDT